MKVNDFKSAQIAQTYGLQNVVDGSTAKSNKKPEAPKGDIAFLSPEAKELLRARRAVQEAPDARAALVAQLRKQVQEGTYEVDEEALARKLLHEFNGLGN